jgi:hypothetical protein
MVFRFISFCLLTPFFYGNASPACFQSAHSLVAETFHYVSFVKQIGKPLSFVLFLYHHDAGLNETKRKMKTITIRNGEESETSDRNGGTT